MDNKLGSFLPFSNVAVYKKWYELRSYKGTCIYKLAFFVEWLINSCGTYMGWFVRSDVEEKRDEEKEGQNSSVVFL